MTTQAPLRSRWTKAESAYHVQVTGDRDDSPVTSSKDTRLEAVACKRLILIEAPSSTYPCGMLSLGNNHSHEEETSCASTRDSTNFMVASTYTHVPCISVS